MRVLFLLGSKSDKEFAEGIADRLTPWEVETEIVVASAHKVPEKVFEIVSSNNKKDQNLVYITIAGRSNGLSGVTAANSVHPVIACPPFKDKDDFAQNINSTLVMPSDTPVMAVVDPGNAAMAAIRILALKESSVTEKLREYIQNIKKGFE